MTHLVEYVLCSNRSLMVRISECISGRTRALYSAFIKMDCKSCPLYLLLMGPLSMLCIVNSCNATGCIIKPWYLYLSLKHRISFCLLRTSLKSIYLFNTPTEHYFMLGILWAPGDTKMKNTYMILPLRSSNPEKGDRYTDVYNAVK